MQRTLMADTQTRYNLDTLCGKYPVRRIGIEGEADRFGKIKRRIYYGKQVQRHKDA